MLFSLFERTGGTQLAKMLLKKNYAKARSKNGSHSKTNWVSFRLFVSNYKTRSSCYHCSLVTCNSGIPKKSCLQSFAFLIGLHGSNSVLYFCRILVASGWLLRKCLNRVDSSLQVFLFIFLFFYGNLLLHVLLTLLCCPFY